MVSKVLIANRGEIALRVIRACQEMGIATVAVHSTADEKAMHVRLADESVCLGPPAAKDSYLNIAAIVSACEITGADAVHPGYGFLSENAKFVDVLDAHHITFIGPTGDHIRLMGDKITAKDKVKELGIPVVPGSDGEVLTVEDAIKVGQDIGYPVLVKASSGGGGRGMKIARNDTEMKEAFSTARSEAKAAFGEDAVYIEKFLEKPRHIEIQVIADTHGNVAHLGERDCSLQRRHQKVFEEAPSTVLDDAAREDIGKIVSTAIKNLGYRGVGTVEFLYEDGKFYFIEMNTRLQVEHPVTEMITGLDLVREQIRIASGEKLNFTQADIEFQGHAVECRINAENAKTFTPSPGLISHYHAPGGLGVRMDSAAYGGYSIPPHYDSLIGKLIIYGRDRDECLMRMKRALNELVIDGIESTIPLFEELLEAEAFNTADYDIHWLENWLENSSES
ncbi:MAG: acetyl-CoA carboxylase biotin carboxylase subunit [Pseudomonadota bacterium]|nr:acetyl-CoA carboxylase biotin carboxylase subunit [Pseudomonadota bacterium]